MKKRYVAVGSLVLYILLLWLLNSLVAWMLFGLILSALGSFSLSALDNRAEARERQELQAAGLTVDPVKITGQKTNTLMFFIILGLVFGFLSYGVDYFLSTLFRILF